MAFAARILADSISDIYQHRLTTFEVTFPRIVLAEVNTHRMLSRSSASSRAQPVAKKISMVESDPFYPAEFGRNTKGMQHTEALGEEDSARAFLDWNAAKLAALKFARSLSDIGVHKQLANRLLEPFSWHTAVLTGTDWLNFFGLRVNPAAQGEFRTAAEMMLKLYNDSEPRRLEVGEWHLPYVNRFEEQHDLRASGYDPVKVSVARCARVSYLSQEGARDPKEDLALYDRLVAPGHMAPLEHVARPMNAMELGLYLQHEVTLQNGMTLRISVTPEEAMDRLGLHSSRPGYGIVSSKEVYYCGNFNGWIQHRKEIPFEADFSARR